MRKKLLIAAGVMLFILTITGIDYWLYQRQGPEHHFDDGDVLFGRYRP